MDIAFENAYQAICSGNTSSYVTVTIIATPDAYVESVAGAKKRSIAINYDRNTPAELFEINLGIPALQQLVEEHGERPTKLAMIDEIIRDHVRVDPDKRVMQVFMVESLDDLVKPIAQLILALLSHGEVQIGEETEPTVSEIALAAVKYAGSILAESATAEVEFRAREEARAHFTELTKAFDLEALLA